MAFANLSLWRYRELVILYQCINYPNYILIFHEVAIYFFIFSCLLHIISYVRQGIRLYIKVIMGRISWEQKITLVVVIGSI